VIALIGANGAGKSTFLKSIAGLQRTRADQILWRGEPIGGTSAASIVGRGIALVPEGRRLFASLTVEENLLLGARLGGAPLDWADVSRYLPRLQERAWQNCASLSGGEMQMLAIARAIAARARLLLLDEPSRGLAPLIVGEVYRALRGLNEDGLGMILVEQKSVPLWRAPDETIVLAAGRVIHRAVAERVDEAMLADLYMSGAR
jgi:branched-chain amino acid transport system ATP-binding protein